MKKRTIVLLVVAVGIAIILIALLRPTSDGKLVYESTEVTRGDVRNVVSVTGHVEPLERIDLAFTVGGALASLPEEGVRVQQGEIIARLDAGVLESQVAEAEARLARERASLSDVLAPPRTEEEDLKRIAITNAERTLAQADRNVRATIDRAFTLADDALHEEADELFRGSRGEQPQFGIRFTYGSTNYVVTAPATVKTALTTGRAAAGQSLNNIEARLGSGEDALSLLEATDSDLRTIETFMNSLAEAINRYIPEDSLAQTVYEGFQTAVASARTAITAARTDVTLALKEYQTAMNTLELAERDLALTIADASEYTVAAQQASVIAAQQGVGTALERVQDMIITAPIGGVVARAEHSIGETVAPFEPVVLLVTEGAYELEAFIPEADIADVKLGDRAVVTLDAFDKTDEFAATVMRIALTETVREGVPTYKTTLLLKGEIPDKFVLRPGMTADIDIATDMSENVLYVPTRSVLRSGKDTYVRVVEDGELVEHAVTTGLRGSFGTTEIVSGLNEGDEVVLYVEEQ